MDSTTLGTIGERLVEAELLKLGFYVARPVVDVEGYDLLAGLGPRQYHKIQIKTCRLPVEHRGRHNYRFTNLQNKRADYFILVCLMHTAFYIVPTEQIPMSLRLSGDGSGHSKLEKFFGAWHILKEASTEYAPTQVVDAE